MIHNKQTFSTTRQDPLQNMCPPPVDRGGEPGTGPDWVFLKEDRTGPIFFVGKKLPGQTGPTVVTRWSHLCYFHEMKKAFETSKYFFKNFLRTQYLLNLSRFKKSNWLFVRFIDFTVIEPLFSFPDSNQEHCRVVSHIFSLYDD